MCYIYIIETQLQYLIVNFVSYYILYSQNSSLYTKHSIQNHTKYHLLILLIY